MDRQLLQLRVPADLPGNGPTRERRVDEPRHRRDVGLDRVARERRAHRSSALRVRGTVEVVDHAAPAEERLHVPGVRADAHDVLGIVERREGFWSDQHRRHAAEEVGAKDASVPGAPQPPGSAGLPGIGETLAFTKDPFGFVQERRARYGRVFRTNLLGRMTAVLVGPEPFAAFYDPENVVRVGANPGNVQTLFGGGGVINNLDGAAHAQRRGSVSAALSRDAIEAYIPTMTRFVDAAFARWTVAGEIGWNAELKQLTIHTPGAVLASIEAESELTALVKCCERIAAAFTALPIPFPGTTYTIGVRAKDEALAYYAELVRAHRDRPHDDGLARLLAAHAADGTAIGDDEAPGELHHLFLAGFVVFAQFAATVVHLTAHA